ncbi:MAG TPA: hypothetical protein VIF37_18035 [Methylobacter sp.]|jgi:hypothetical protein
MPAMFGAQLQNCKFFIAGMARSYDVIVINSRQWRVVSWERGKISGYTDVFIPS